LDFIVAETTRAREDALRAFALIGAPCPNIVMAGLDPAIHVFLVTAQ
jgi:hypothetical protein